MRRVVGKVSGVVGHLLFLFFSSSRLCLDQLDSELVLHRRLIRHQFNSEGVGIRRSEVDRKRAVAVPKEK